MPSLPPAPSTACAHDLGPGITVCLRCRQERRDAARARQQRLFAVVGVGLLGLLGVYVLAASATNALRAATRSDTARVAPRASVVASSVRNASDVKQLGQTAAAAAPMAAVTTAAAVVHAPLEPIVREGRTDLPESLVAERGGDSVLVDFDTPDARTRRRDKFEGVVRRTLPLVYGAVADSMLRTLPAGAIVGDAELLTELPKRGVHLSVGNGWTLDLWPQTRPGQDGPLMVSYWARVTRDGSFR